MLDLLQEAQRLREQGLWAEAEAMYCRVLESAPDQPTCWYNLAFVQRMQGRHEHALASYAEALRRRVSHPEEVHLNRAVIYADHLRREDEAERELKAALALSPRYAPALFNLANLKEDRGARSEAIDLYRSVLEIEPSSHEALARLAQLVPVVSSQDAIVSRLRSALIAPLASVADKASLGFALGRVLDQAGAYDEAFAAYTEANRMSRASAGSPRLYDRFAQEKLIDEIIAAFPPPKPAPSPTAEPPIFICGMFRSGSTLTEQILAGHPRVTAGGELEVLSGLARSIGYPTGLENVSEEQIVRLANRYQQHIARLFPGADRITDKQPTNFLYVGLAKRLFPQAKIVHTTRHPLDNVLSLFFLHLDHRLGYALDLGDAAHYYRQYRRLMAHWKNLFGNDILDFSYDAFVHEPRPAVERLLEFADLDWNDECLAFHRRTNVVKTASVWQVREPLYQRSSGRWRNYERRLAAARDSLSDFLETYCDE